MRREVVRAKPTHELYGRIIQPVAGRWALGKLGGQGLFELRHDQKADLELGICTETFGGESRNGGIPSKTDAEQGHFPDAMVRNGMVVVRM